MVRIRGGRNPGVGCSGRTRCKRLCRAWMTEDSDSSQKQKQCTCLIRADRGEVYEGKTQYTMQ